MSSRIRFNKNGVHAFPDIPPSFASASARSIARSDVAPSASCSAGMGTARTVPPKPITRPALTTAAASRGVSTRHGALTPLFLVKNAGNSSTPKLATQTPCVSRYSNVRGMSNTLLAPAHTTHTGVRPSSVRSAETSNVLWPSRCTPPTPPVTKMEMPAACARSMVALTVVAPVAPFAMQWATSRRDTLSADGPKEASCTSWSSVRPTRGTPSMMAMVAGVAPCSRTMASTSRAIVRLSG